MPYTPPSSSELNEHFHHLFSDYKNVGRDSISRRTFIFLITSFKEQPGKSYDHLAAVGICIYVLYKIESEYRFFSPHKNKNVGGMIGSDLYPIIEKCLDTGEFNPNNTLNEQQALIYLNALLMYAKDRQKFDERHGNDQERLALITEVETMMKPMLQRLLKKRPTYLSLIKNFSKMSEQYQEQKNNRYIKFIQTLNQDLLKNYPSSNPDSESYGIRYGAVLYIMTLIKPESSSYISLSFLSGWFDNSIDLEIYKNCQAVANIKYVEEVPPQLRKKYYGQLLNYSLSKTLDHKHPDQFYLDMQIALAGHIVEIIKQEDGGKRSYVEIIAENAAKYGVTIALGKLVSQISIEAPLKYLSLIKPEYALFLTLVSYGYAVKTCVIKQISEKINSFLVNTVSGSFNISFIYFGEFINFCTNLFTSDAKERNTELIDDPQFLRTLETLPLELFSTENQETMGYVVGLEKSKELEKKPEMPDSLRILKFG